MQQRKSKEARKIFLWTVVVIALFAGIYYVVFPYWVAYQVRGIASFSGSYTMNTRPICFHIAGHRFLVPRNYLIHRYSGDNVRTTTVVLYVLLPDMKPYTQETKAEFEKLGHNNKLSILVQESGPGYATVAESFERFKDDFPNETARDQAIPDLQVFASRYTGSEREMYVKLENGRATYQAICSIVGTNPSDSCRTYLDYSKNIHAGYSFGRPHLKRWKAVEEGIRNLVRSFETAADLNNVCKSIPNI